MKRFISSTLCIILGVTVGVAVRIATATLTIPQGYVYYSGNGNDLVSTTSWSGVLPTDVIPIQRARAQTDTNGIYTWVYPVAYGGGVVPIVSALPEDATANSGVDVKITSRSSTSTSFQVSKTVNVSILGVNVTQLVASPQAYLNLIAIQP